jgi:hypothetical protein
MAKVKLISNQALNDRALQKIIEFMEYHLDDCPLDEDFEDITNEALTNVKDNRLLFDIICGLIKGKTCQEVRDILKTENDLTPEEEAIREENKWNYFKD